LGNFHNTREYVKRGADGCIIDITNDLYPFGTNGFNVNLNIVYSGLSDPHSLTWNDGNLYYAESRKRSIAKSGKEFLRFERGYIRGLLFKNGSLFIGVSTSRHADYGECGNADILHVFTKTLERIKQYTIPAKEIYSIIFPLQ